MKKPENKYSGWYACQIVRLILSWQGDVFYGEKIRYLKPVYNNYLSKLKYGIEVLKEKFEI